MNRRLWNVSQKIIKIVENLNKPKKRTIRSRIEEDQLRTHFHIIPSIQPPLGRMHQILAAYNYYRFNTE